MQPVLIVHLASDADLARSLASRLEGWGYLPRCVTSLKLFDDNHRARCTLVLLTPLAHVDKDFLEAAECAAQFNVMIPVRTDDTQPGSIAEPYRRARPCVITGVLEHSPIAISDHDGLAASLAQLWPRSDDAVVGAPSQLHASAAPSNPFFSLLPAIVWIAFCIVGALLIDISLRSFNPYSTVGALRPEVELATVRRRGTQAVEWLSHNPNGPRLRTTPPTFTSASEHTILVHGYNVAARQIPTYFDDLIASVGSGTAPTKWVVLDWASGVRAPNALTMTSAFWGIFDRFLLDTVNSELELYDLGRRNAEGKASDGLITLIDTIYNRNGNRRVNIIAHSMGCYVAIQALKKRSDLADRIGTLVFLAPAIPHDALGEPATSGTLSRIPKVHLFHSRNDSILNRFAAIRHAAPMLGAIGPRDKNSVPGSMMIHDVTSALGNRDVHSRYLQREGLQRLDLARLLR